MVRGDGNKKQQKRNVVWWFFTATLVMWGVSVGFELVSNKRKELVAVIYGCLFFQIANWVLRYWVSREPLFVNTSVSLLHSSFASASDLGKMSSTFMKIVKFTGRNSFALWLIKMRAFLKQQGIWKSLVKEETSKQPSTSSGLSEAELEAMEEKAHSSILLCLADDVITEVADETMAAGLWLKLESLYMTKSLTNKLLLKQHLFALRMQAVVFILVSQWSAKHSIQMFDHEELVRNTWPWAYTALCVSCGYFAYDQWDMLTYGLYNGWFPSILAHHLILLLCFTLALYRNVTINYLILTLICELHSVFLHVRKVRRMAGIRSAESMIVKVEWVFNWLTFLFARLVPHAMILIKLVKDASKFDKGVELPLALFGMIGMNLLNIGLGIDILGAYKREKNPPQTPHSD